MLITEIGFIKVSSGDTPAQTFIRESTILKGIMPLKPMGVGYEPTYHIYLAPTFTVIFDNKEYAVNKDIMGYSGQCELDIYEFNSLGNKRNARINHLVIDNLSKLEFDLGTEGIDYADWEFLQSKERFAVFGREV